MTIAKLGSPIDFYERNFRGHWWVSTIQSYPQLTTALRGEGLQQHHLIPRSLFLKGPPATRDLVDYVPSITLDGAEHQSTAHSALNDFLRSHDLWQKPLSSKELKRAIELSAEFYERRGLPHFAEAIRGFQKEAFDKIA